MTTPTGSARDACERNAQAVMTGNLPQVMADITPEVLGQMMQMATAAGGMSPTAMPNIERYEIVEAPSEDDGEVFHVTFFAPQGRVTLGTTWKQLMGQWKVTNIALVSFEVTQP